MQTIQFDTYIENGVITIPLRYQKTISHSVRVIVQPKEEVSNISQFSERKTKLFSLDVDMSGFVFDRNEINER